MQELRNRLIAEVGLSAEQAQKTIDSVLGFVKSKRTLSISFVNSKN